MALLHPGDYNAAIMEEEIYEIDRPNVNNKKNGGSDSIVLVIQIYAANCGANTKFVRNSILPYIKTFKNRGIKFEIFNIDKFPAKKRAELKRGKKTPADFLLLTYTDDEGKRHEYIGVKEINSLLKKILAFNNNRAAASVEMPPQPPQRSYSSFQDLLAQEASMSAYNVDKNQREDCDPMSSCIERSLAEAKRRKSGVPAYNMFLKKSDEDMNDYEQNPAIGPYDRMPDNNSIYNNLASQEERDQYERLIGTGSEDFY